jgi:hypothetical protein
MLTIHVTLPICVIEADRRLESSANETSLALMEHRWHWTLDESNPDKVTISEYARQIGCSFTNIKRYAKGFVIFREQSPSGRRLTADEAKWRATMGAETEAAAEAVATKHARTIGQAMKEHRPEIKAIREEARERAEEKGTTTVDEVPRSAELFYEVLEQPHGLLTQTGLGWLQLDGRLSHAGLILQELVEASGEIPLDAEERVHLRAHSDKLKQLLALFDRLISGRSDDGWKKELQLIQGGVA